MEIGEERLRSVYVMGCTHTEIETKMEGEREEYVTRETGQGTATKLSKFPLPPICRDRSHQPLLRPGSLT